MVELFNRTVAQLAVTIIVTFSVISSHNSYTDNNNNHSQWSSSTINSTGTAKWHPAPLLPPGMEVIPAGSYIVNMSVEPQTLENALKPYGFIYELINTYKVPLKWSIKPGKAKDGIDFSYNGTDFRAGPFIITAPYRTPEVNATIAAWEAEGMIGVTTTSDITVPIYETFTYTLRWTLDQENGQIAEEYLNLAGIPSESFSWRTLDSLECCNDVFVIPHAHPEWESHKYLLAWNDSKDNGGCAGAIWAGCRAVSNLENLYNPADPSVVSNFLMMDANPPTTFPAVWHGDHDDGSIPPAYQYDHHDHPIMQFLGLIDGATEGGSEQIYLPTVGWRPATLVGIWDDSHPDVPSQSPGKAAKLVFGPGFGEEERGYVVYEGGHKLGSGGDPQSVAALRAFFNFSFMAIQRKAIKVTVSIPNTMEAGNAYPVTATATGGSGDFVFEWESDCAGTFQNPFSASTTFTPTGATPPGGCFMKVNVTDECATRVGFGNVNITVVPTPAPPIAVDDSANTQPGTPVLVDALANDSDPNLDPITLTLIGSGITTNGTFVNHGDGTVTYTSDPTYIGLDSIDYEICDTTAMCDTATIVINVNIIDANGCFPTEYYAEVSQGYADITDSFFDMKDEDEPLGALDNVGAEFTDVGSWIILDLTDTIPQGDTIIIYLSKKDAGKVGIVDITGSVNNSGFSDLLSHTITSVEPVYETVEYIINQSNGVRFLRLESNVSSEDKNYVDGLEYTIEDCVSALPVAVDDEVTTLEDTPVNYEVLVNDSDPQSLSLITEIISGPSNGLGVVEADETVTYYPNTDFNGMDTILYRACNTQGVCDSAIHVVTIISDGCPPGFVPTNTSDTLILNPTQDTWITEQNTTDNSGSCTTLQVDKENSQPDHTLIKFDLSSLPAGTVITQAELVLTKTGGSASGYEVSVHQVTNDWIEGTQCTSTGSSNWDDRLSGTSWTNPGGDFDPVAEDNILVSADGIYQWDVKLLLQDWANGVSNFGFLLKATTEVGGNDALIFASNENATAGDRPRLNVYYYSNTGPCVVDSPGPIAINDSTTTQQVTSVAVEVIANDFGGNSALDPASVDTSGLLAPGNGSITSIDTTTGYVTYLPETDFIGLDSFEYTVCNLNALCDTAMVYIQVNCSPPVANNCTGSFRDSFLNIAYNGSDGTQDWSSTPWDEIGDGSDDTTTGAIAVRNSGNSYGGTGNTLKTHLGHGNSAPGVYVYREIDLSLATSATLSFYLRHDLSGTDTIALEISNNGGASWQVLKNFTAANADPANESFDISPYLTANTRIRFILVNIGGGGAIWTDNIEISYNCGPDPNGNYILGTVFNDADIDGIFNNGDTGRDSVHLYLYEDVNEDELLDGGDLLIDSIFTDSIGNYTLDVSSIISGGGSDSITLNSNSSAATSGTASSLTWSHTVASGNDRVLMVGLSMEGGEATGVTYGGVPMTLAGRYTGAQGHTVEFWQLIAPNVGTANIIASFNSSREVIGGGQAFNGVHQTTPTGSIQGASQENGDTPSVTISSAVDEVVMDALFMDVPTTAAAAVGQTESWELTNGRTGAGSTKAGATSVTMTWNMGTSEEWNLGAITIKPAGAGTPSSGKYIIQVDTTSIPGVFTFSTDNIETASFTTSGQTDCRNNFGLNVNFPPVAINDTTSTEETVPIDIIVINNDYDPDSTTLTVTLLIPPTDGTVTNNGDGSVTYETTTPGFTGLDTFTYEICDAGIPILCDSATVYVTVTPFFNNPPFAVNDYDTTVVNADIAVEVLANDYDLDGDGLTVSLNPGILQPANGTIFLYANQKIEYQPNPLFIGDDSFEYIVCDDRSPSLCDTATVFIYVFNRPPDARDDNVFTLTDTALVINVLNNDFEPDGHDMIINGVGTDVVNGATIQGGTASVNDNGTPLDPSDDFIDYTPAPGFVGYDTVYYDIYDSVTPALYDTAMIVIKVTGPIDLELQKTALPYRLSLGDTVTFTITLINQGIEQASGILVVDRLPAELTYVSDDSGGMYDPVSGIWNVGILNASGSIQLQILAENTGGNNTVNISEVYAANQIDIDSIPNNDDGDQSEDDEDDALLILSCPPANRGGVILIRK